METLPANSHLEQYFKQYAFKTKYMMCGSDAEPWDMADILQMADDECKTLWANLNLGYTEIPGHHLLRKEIAKIHDVSAEDILVVGPQEGIYIAMKCLANIAHSQNQEKAIHAITTFPGYQSLHENLITSKIDVCHWEPRHEAQGWNFVVEDLVSLININTKILVVNFPHNPTGFIPEKETWLKIINLCKERDIFLFSDEMYYLTSNDGSKPLPSACALYENAISLFGMSKTFGLAGLRIGWLATKNQMVKEKLANFKDYLTKCPPAPCEILSIIALRNAPTLLEHTLSICKENLKLVDAFFKKYPSLFTWHAPKAGTTAFVQIKSWLLNIGKGGAKEFCYHLEKENGVLLLPAYCYSYKDEYVRVGLGRKNMDKCIEGLENFIQKHTSQ